MSTHEIASTQAQGQLVSTDFNRFEQFLESLGLPKENVLVLAPLFTDRGCILS